MEKINKVLLELYEDKKQIALVFLLAFISHALADFIPSDENVNQATGVAIGIGLAITGGAMLYGTMSGNSAMNEANKLASDNNDLANQIAADQLKFQKEQQAKLDVQKDVYRSFVFENPYENVENVFDDLRVNVMQAQFEATQGQQMRADVMQGLSGAAGSSGIAGLAQVLANQSQTQMARSAASIGMQESQNQQLKMQGASAADMAERGGEAMVQQMEADRQSTLLGIQMGQTSGANAALQQAYSNQMASGAAMANMYGQQAAGLYGMAGSAMGSFAGMAGAYAGAQ